MKNMKREAICAAHIIERARETQRLETVARDCECGVSGCMVIFQALHGWISGAAYFFVTATVDNTTNVVQQSKMKTCDGHGRQFSNVRSPHILP